MNLIMRAAIPRFPGHLPKAPHSNTITPRVGSSHRNWKRDLTLEPEHPAAEQMEGAGRDQHEGECSL